MFERELEGLKKFEPYSRSHECLVDILQVGQCGDEYFYYVMEAGDDLQNGSVINPHDYEPRSLSQEILRRQRLPVAECVRIGLSLCAALDYLHRNGLIHRDVKPSNIIFIQGVPKLADIGLVTTTTEANSYVGTEGFIPPEGPTSARADVYSLGKVLYEASTGKDRTAFPQVPDDLWAPEGKDGFLEFNEILLRACQNDPVKRYQSTADLASDLLLFDKGKSIRRLRLLEKRFQLLKRVFPVALSAALVFGGIYYGASRDRAREALFRQRQAGIELAHGIHAMEDGNLVTALHSFVEAL